MTKTVKPAGQKFEYGEISKDLWGIVDPFGKTHKVEGTEKDVEAWIEEFVTDPEKFREEPPKDATE
jgi:hypothetical protein